MPRTTWLFASLLVAAQCYAANEAPLGVYSTVSESEYAMELRLSANHVATLEVASWEPGDRQHPVVKRFRGSWNNAKGKVVTTFKRGAITFEFNPHLSFDTFGQSGAAPGLIATSSSFDSRTYVGQYFWLKSELNKLKW